MKLRMISYLSLLGIASVGLATPEESCGAGFRSVSRSDTEPELDRRIDDLARLDLDQIQKPDLPSSTRVELQAEFDKKIEEAHIKTRIPIAELQTRIRVAKQRIFFSGGNTLSARDSAVRREREQLRSTEPHYALASTLLDTQSSIRTIAICPGGKCFAAGTADGKIWIWTLDENGSPNGRPSDRTVSNYAPKSINSIAFSPDGRSLAIGVDNGLRVLKLASETAPEELTTIGGRDPDVVIDAVAISPDGRWIANAGQADGGYISSAAGWNNRPFPRDHGGAGALAFNADGSYLASGGVYQQISLRKKESDGEYGESRRFGDADRTAYSLAFHPQLTQLAVAMGGHLGGHDEGLIQIWDTERQPPTALVDLKDHNKPVRSLAYDPTGRVLASGSYDKAIKI